VLSVEKRIDSLYLDSSSPEKSYRIETYRSSGSISATNTQSVRCYFVTRSALPAYTKSDQPAKIENISDPAFLEKASDNTKEIYQGIIGEVEKRSAPVIEVYEVEGTREMRVVMGFKVSFRLPMDLHSSLDANEELSCRWAAPTTSSALSRISTTSTVSTRRGSTLSTSATASPSFVSHPSSLLDHGNL
jgi:hypothetical protein